MNRSVLILVALVVLAIPSSFAQQLDYVNLPAPGGSQTKERKFALSKTSIGFLAAEATVRALDAHATNLGMKYGYHEDNLSDSIAHNPGAMWTYSMGIAGLSTFLSWQLERHGHQYLARVMPTLDVSITLPAVLNDFSVLRDGGH